MGNIGGMYFAECIQLNGTLRELDIGDTDLVSLPATVYIGILITMRYHCLYSSSFKVKSLVSQTD